MAKKAAAAGVKKAAVKKAVKKAAVKKTVKKAAVKKAVTKAAVKKTVKKAAVKKAVVKKAAAPKLTDNQRDLLKKVIAAKLVGGYIGEKLEDRALKALVARRILKTAKTADKKAIVYMLTKAGEKAVGS